MVQPNSKNLPKHKHIAHRQFGYMGTWYMGTWVQGYMGIWYMGTGYMGTWYIHGYIGWGENCSGEKIGFGQNFRFE